MVTIHRGSNWKIALYARDHGIPHFHIEAWVSVVRSRSPLWK
jgi:hypothetical protein